MATYKKVLTVEDLLKFCENNKFYSFNSEKSGYQLAVKVPTTFEVDTNVDDNHCGMMKLKFRIFHTGLNRNGSFVSTESAKKAMSTIADRPVLAAIHQLDNGDFDFEGHEMEIVKNENGEEELRYIESQVGSFSSEPAFWEHDDELNKDYVCAYAYISEEYTKAAEIIRRKNGTKNSCELYINDMSYNAKEKYLELNDFFVNGSTLLGSRDDGTEIGEGMLGSRADIADFSTENNAVKFECNEKLIETLEKLNATLSNFNIDTTRKEDEELKKDELENFEDETLKVLPDEDVDVPTDDEEDDDATTGDDAVSTQSETEDDETSTEPDADTTPDEEQTFELKYSVSNGDNTKDFSLSLNDKQMAINDLVNELYGEQDNEYYFCDVYEDDGYVVMHGWSGRHYKQSFKCKKEKYSLVGDRVEVYAQYLTEDEIKKLDDMRSNYSLISEKLEKYESEPSKTEILGKAKYKYVVNTDEFVELTNNHFDLSVDEVKAKADEILLSYAEQGKLDFSIKEKTDNVTKKQIPSMGYKKTSRYGNLFSK